MGVFTVDLTNQPGELARFCEAVAAENVNLVLCATAQGQTGRVAFIADDEAAARGALQEAGYDVAEHSSLTVRMTNTPGAGAALFRVLAGAGVNLTLFLPIRIFDDQFYAVIAVDDADKARAALGEQVVTE
jgi:hypothetical protein